MPGADCPGCETYVYMRSTPTSTRVSCAPRSAARATKSSSIMPSWPSSKRIGSPKASTPRRHSAAGCCVMYSKADLYLPPLFSVHSMRTDRDTQPRSLRCMPPIQSSREPKTNERASLLIFSFVSCRARLRSEEIGSIFHINWNSRSDRKPSRSMSASCTIRAVKFSATSTEGKPSPKGCASIASLAMAEDAVAIGTGAS